MKKELVENLLKDSEKFRERSQKDKGIIYLIQKCNVELREIPEETLLKVVKDYTSMDRSWRDALMHNPELRGTDYDDKTDLEMIKRKELGY